MQIIVRIDRFSIWLIHAFCLWNHYWLLQGALNSYNQNERWKADLLAATIVEPWGNHTTSQKEAIRMSAKYKESDLAELDTD